MALLAVHELPDARVDIVRRDDREKSFEGVFSDSKNLFAFFPDMAFSESRYLRQGSSPFKQTGQLVFRPSGMQVQARGAARVNALQCWLDDSRMDAFSRMIPCWTDERLSRTLDIPASNLGSYLLRLRQEVTCPSLAAPTVIDALLVLMVHDLALYLADDARAPCGEGGSEHGYAIKRVVERIMDMTELTPTVGELAEMTALSPRHLLRLFREAKGVSLVEFIRQTRLEHARQLLSTTRLPLKEIAYRLGFSSHASFSTAFRRELNATPCQYRRDMRRAATPLFRPARTTEATRASDAADGFRH